MTKLTENRVRVIKRFIERTKGNTRMQMVAKQFQVSIAQIYRIKRGVIWQDLNASTNY